MEDDTWKEEEVSHWSPSQLCPDSPPSTTLAPAALLPANAAFPHAVGPGALPGVANPLLSLLHRREERRKQEERWCEGKSPGASRPDSGRDLLSGLTNGDTSGPGPSPLQIIRSVLRCPPLTKFAGSRLGVADGLGCPEHRRGGRS